MVRYYLKMTFHHPPTRNFMSALSQLLLTRFWLNFKSGWWEHLEQIPSVMLTFVWATFVLATFVHIRNISAVPDPILRLWQGQGMANQGQGKVKASSRQVQGKFNARLRQGQRKVIKAKSGKGQNKVKGRSRQCWGRVNAMSREGQGKVKKRSRQGQGNANTTSTTTIIWWWHNWN